jgi:hypothetical protein
VGRLQRYVVPGAPFAAQCEPLVDVKSVEAYTEWMAAVGKNTLEGCSYDLRASAYDEGNRSAIFFATFTGTHVGEGGPVPPTHKQTVTDYVYVLTMNGDGRVAKMVKVWNAPWTLKELGWM